MTPLLKALAHKSVEDSKRESLAIRVTVFLSLLVLGAYFFSLSLNWQENLRVVENAESPYHFELRDISPEMLAALQDDEPDKLTILRVEASEAASGEKGFRVQIRCRNIRDTYTACRQFLQRFGLEENALLEQGRLLYHSALLEFYGVFPNGFVPGPETLMSYLGYAFLLVLLILLFAFLVGSAFRQWQRERRRELALLQSAGMESRQIRRYLLWRSYYLSRFPLLVAIGAAYLLSVGMRAYVGHFLEEAYRALDWVYPKDYRFLLPGSLSLIILFILSVSCIGLAAFMSFPDAARRQETAFPPFHFRTNPLHLYMERRHTVPFHMVHFLTTRFHPPARRAASGEQSPMVHDFGVYPNAADVSDVDAQQKGCLRKPVTCPSRWPGKRVEAGLARLFHAYYGRSEGKLLFLLALVSLFIGFFVLQGGRKRLLKDSLEPSTSYPLELIFWTKGRPPQALEEELSALRETCAVQLDITQYADSDKYYTRLKAEGESPAAAAHLEQRLRDVVAQYLDSTHWMGLGSIQEQILNQASALSQEIRLEIWFGVALLFGAVHSFQSFLNLFLSRQREFLRLEAVGMTSGQIRRTLLWEIFYTLAKLFLLILAELLFLSLALSLGEGEYLTFPELWRQLRLPPLLLYVVALITSPLLALHIALRDCRAALQNPLTEPYHF